MTTYDGNLSSYKTISILGHCFDDAAVVHLAKHVRSGAMVAIKKFDMDRIKEDVNLVESEIILTKQLQHPNIIKYLIAFVSGPEVCVVSPLMAYGSCRDLITRHFNEGALMKMLVNIQYILVYHVFLGLPEPAIIRIIQDVVVALQYIHKKGYIHRAIRGGHVLISAEGTAHLSGFRYACPIVLNGKWQRSLHTFPATTERNLNFLSPELLEQNLHGYNEKSDIYSIGMLICELANGVEPFAGTPKTLMLTEKFRGCTPQLLDGSTIPRDDNLDCGGDCEISTNILNRRFSDDLHELSAICLFRDAYERPCASEILTHPIFKTLKKTLPLPELLKPAMPLSDRVGYDTDEMENLETLSRMSQLEIYSCEWEF